MKFWFAKMKVRYSTCGPHEESDINFGPVRHFGWYSCSTYLYLKLSVALNSLLMLLSHALSQYSVNRTKNFLSRARPTPARSTLRVPATRPANAGTHNSREVNPPRE